MCAVAGAMARDASPPPGEAQARVIKVRRSAQLCQATFSDNDIQNLVRSEAAAQGVDEKLALAISMQESRHGRDLNSPAGARGPMQLMPGTAAQYGVEDICDPAQNIRGGVHYLKDLTALFQGNAMLTAAAYNAGPEAVFRARGVPPIAETVRYVAAVTNTYFGLDVLSTRKSRLTRMADKEAAPSARAALIADARDASGAAAKLNWIGGSVLYVSNEDGEKQYVETK
ncbi:soluble lytic murein transglycosylase-like protein [Rhodoblastus acidophilus]|nr:soluble lytic murein transglycosylase-like protein [Rhodoblastus acidophilus]MCW2335371.1 soluble lytic murein transglycosylase-like protein [Rhodoblastus acidophilus]